MKYHFVALFTIFVWGITFVSTKVLLVDLSPLWILLLRFAIGFLILAALRLHILKCKEKKDELLFMAAFVWAIYSTLVSHLANKGYETIATTKRTFAWGLAFILIITVIFDPTLPTLSVLYKEENLFNLLFLGAIASAACFVTWGIAVKHLGATITTTYIYLVPAITATASIIILSEPLNASIVIGIVLTIAGLLLSQKRAS